MNRTDRHKSVPFAFDRWRFDAATGDLHDGQKSIHLEPRVAKLLEYFFTHQDTLISRDELMAAVWENRIVSDDAINRCISILRQILSPDDRNAYIETVVRRGFISHFPEAPISEPPKSPAIQKKNYLVLAVIATAAVMLYLSSDQFSGPPPEVEEQQRQSPPLVAVLPFSTTGRSEDSEFFANGMHDDLLTQLAQLQSMRVVSRTSVLEYRDSRQNTRDIGRELGADAILEGGIQHLGNQIRINMQLIDAHTDEHIWARQYDRELLPAKIFEVQSEIARSIALALQATLSTQEIQQLSMLPTENMAAYRAYHEAMEIRDVKTANAPAFIDALEKAVALDPNFVRAWAELAGALSLSNFDRQDPDSIRRIEEILEHIRALAPQSADHLIAQTFFTYYILKDYDRARQLVDQALARRPNDVHALELRSWIDRRLGDFAGKIESVRQARALDPRNPLWTNVLALNLMMDHQYDEASRVVNDSPVQSQLLSVVSNTLQLREHKDFTAWLEHLEEIRTEFGDDAYVDDLWEAYVANRNFTAADNLLEALKVSDEAGIGIGANFADFDLYPIVTYWFLGDLNRLTPLLDQSDIQLEDQTTSNDGRVDLNQRLKLAYLAAARGETEEAERLIRDWRRAAEADQAVLANNRHFACRALGMVGAAQATVECIREGLVQPSYIMPFMEPYLPYYDSIRETPEFVALLDDTQSD